MEEEDAMETEGVATPLGGAHQSPGPVSLLALASGCPAPQCTPPTHSLLPTSPPLSALSSNMHHQQQQQQQQASEDQGAQGCPHTLEEVANMRYTSAISQQVSVAEFNMQAHYVTQQALRDLKASPEYKKYTMRCHSCGCSWYDGQFSEGCKECSGFAMDRPCPICHGHCGTMWRRNVEMSHTHSEGHWDGVCGHKDAARLLKDLVRMDNITQGIKTLATRETSQ